MAPPNVYVLIDLTSIKNANGALERFISMYQCKENANQVDHGAAVRRGCRQEHPGGCNKIQTKYQFPGDPRVRVN